MDKRELYSYTGNEGQLYGVRRMAAAEGKAAGTPVIQVYTAAGLQLDIYPAMGLDIGRVSYKGVNMSFLCKNGADGPAAFIPNESEFSNSFPGGMLYTCGLRSAGPPNRDGGEWHPLHGRIHGQPARQLCAAMQGSDIVVSGELRESALFGHLLQLRRTITVPAWGGSITVNDTIENLTPTPQEYMLLYHINFGYPMLSEHAALRLPTRKDTRPRTPDAERGMGSELNFTPPIDGEPEQVFFHTMATAEAVLENQKLGLAATLRWSLDTLPILAQWKSMASGDYALGLEPANNYIMGRAAERENGTLQTLAAFESMQAMVQLDFAEL